MKTLFWALCILVGCSGCSKPFNIPVASSSKMPSATASSSDKYDATALLDNKPWFGSAFAQREHTIEGKLCTTNQFALGLSTDLPHALSGNEPVRGITGCKGTCVPTQRIGFHRIPLAVGRYKLSDIQSCIEGDTQKAGEYSLLIGGDGIVDRYYPLGVTVQLGTRSVLIPGTDTSWIEVTNYDAKTDRVEGSFELTLKNTTGKEVHFSAGAFDVRLTR